MFEGFSWRTLVIVPVAVILLLLILFRRHDVPAAPPERERALRVEAAPAVVEIAPARSLPVPYAVGTIDPRFNTDVVHLQSILREAKGIWESAAGRDLFREEEGAPLAVNLVFDERQRNKIESNLLRSDIESRDTSRNILIGQYEEERALAGRLEADYKEESAALNKRTGEYNETVASWNARGGAPPEEVERLHNEQASIAAASDALERKRKRFNEVADDVSSLAASINNLGSRNNREIRDYNGRFGRGGEYEKGIFDGRVINVYEFENDDDLRITLVHELGHALGFGHVADPAAVMYYKLASQEIHTIKLAPADLALLDSLLQRPARAAQ